MQRLDLARRLRRLPVRPVLGRPVPVAAGRRSRLLGLAWLQREGAGEGLLIPRCSSVHTFGMRFPLDLYFLSPKGEVIEVRRAVPRRRIVSCPGADAVLEVPAEGGEVRAAGSLARRASGEEKDRDDRRL
jgi:uncharacterized protein